jgi:hypothetical protein
MEGPVPFGYHYYCGSDNAVLDVPAEITVMTTGGFGERSKGK